MTTATQSTNPVTRDWILAGDATFTVELPDGSHYTYRVQKTEPSGRYPNPAWFAKLLTGSDNTSSYSYLGKLDDFSGQVAATAKSKLKSDSLPVKLLNRILARIWAGDFAAFESKGYKVHHEGRCGRCGRKLTTPESVERGIGPECAEIMGVATGGRRPTEEPAPSGDVYQQLTQQAASQPRRESENSAFHSDLGLGVGAWPQHLWQGSKVFTRHTAQKDREGDLELMTYQAADGSVFTVFND